MSTDITTLAIEIQSQEAERNLRTFNELLSLSSQTAQKMEKVSIAIDVNDALSQLQALKAGYDELAASAQNVHFDMGTPTPPAVAPDIDTTALDMLKEFFATSAEMSKAFRQELEQFSEAVQKLEADSVKISTAGGRSVASMRNGVAVSREYAAALRELNAAQKEMEKAVAKADEAMKATVAADKDAEEVKQRIAQAERELATVSRQLSETHRGRQGDILGLMQREQQLKNTISELQSVYEKAQETAERYYQKLEDAGMKAGAATARFKELKAQVDVMPMGGAAQSTQTFAEQARLAGSQLTKLARGFNSVAIMAGGAIPGVSGLGRAISMFGFVNPYIAATAVALGGLVAIYREYDKVIQNTAVAARKMAEEQAKLVNSFKEEAQERKTNLERLAVLNSYENLYDSEKEESRRIVEKLTASYKGLGIQYDAITGKILNLAEVTKGLNEQEAQKLLETLKENAYSAMEAAQVQLAVSHRNSLSFLDRITGGDTDVDRAFFEIEMAGDIEEQLSMVKEFIKICREEQIKGSFDSWLFDLDNVEKELLKVKETLEEAQKHYEIYKETREEINGGGHAEQERIERIRELEAKLQAARDASMTNDEKFAANVAKIQELEERKSEFAVKNEADLVEYNGKVISAKEAQLEIETELVNRTRERLAYEKQLEAVNGKIEAQKRLWDIDAEGNIVRRKTDDERRTDRDGRIAELQKQIQELREKIAENEDEAHAKLLERDIGNAQLELNGLQQERIAENEREQQLAEAAKKRLAEATKAYVIDAEGNIVRRKTSDELAAVLQEEIEAARLRVAAAKEGTRESDETKAELASKQAQKLAQDEALEAARRRAEEAKRGLVFDQNHNIVREQTEAEMMIALKAEIEAQRDRVAKLQDGTQERAEADAKLTELQRKEYEMKKQQAEKAKREREAANDAKKRADDAKKGYVWDAQGNVVRRKTEEELAEERKKEIDAAKAKVDATKAGTKERYEAEEELRRLQIADFNAREGKGGDGSLGMLEDERKVNSNLVKAVDAKSTEALALQARNFTRGADPEKKVEASLKEIEKLTVEIRDFVTECKNYLDEISASSSGISQKIVAL